MGRKVGTYRGTSQEEAPTPLREGKNRGERSRGCPEPLSGLGENKKGPTCFAALLRCEYGTNRKTKSIDWKNPMFH